MFIIASWGIFQLAALKSISLNFNISLEKTLMLGKFEGRRRRGWQRMRWLDGITTLWTWVWVSSGSLWWTGKPGMLQSMGSQRVGRDWVSELKIGRVTDGLLLSPYHLHWYREGRPYHVCDSWLSTEKNQDIVLEKWLISGLRQEKAGTSHFIKNKGDTCQKDTATSLNGLPVIKS